MNYYSQNDEEKYITEYFLNYNNGRGGKLIEIGAFHPTKFSNTRKLFEQGWQLVQVEPSPQCMAKLREEYGKEPRVQLLQCAISDSDGFVEFFETEGGDAIGTTDVFHKDKWERGNGVKYTPIQVKTMSMQTLLNSFGNDVDFINIDVEGTNLKLFSLLPNDFLNRLKMICVEHDGYNQVIEDKLKVFGFRTVCLNPENIIMVK